MLQKYDVPGPRYTSYPTAPQWGAGVGEDAYREVLKAFGQNRKNLSLYIHIPFCEQLCYFCACNRVIRPQEEKVGDEFLSYLFVEMDRVADAIGGRKRVCQLHWGGGTPTYLSETQSKRLFDKTTSLFDVNKTEEIAIEVDPRTVTANKLKALRSLGFNRISLGVQDFELRVLEAINRLQPQEDVESIYRYCRDLKFESVNFDLVYGLPYQTKSSFKKTIDRVIHLRPDRIALYSFAHVPWISKPQNKFSLDAMPKTDEKLDIFLQSRADLLAGGYRAIAMDHFALTSDAMAEAFNTGILHRNFMGYTLKAADTFIGFGPSAIGFLEDTYVQNTKILPEYYQKIAQGGLAVERGKQLTEDDKIRHWVIHRLMCQFQVNKQEFLSQFGYGFDDYFDDEAGHIRRCLEDGLIEENSLMLRVSDVGKIFIRNVCMGFDYYLRTKHGQKHFSRTI